MATYTQEGVAVDDLNPVTISAQYTSGYVRPGTSADGDMQEVKVVARFDWQFWAALAAGAAGLYVLLRSMRHAGRLPTRKRVSRRMR